MKWHSDDELFIQKDPFWDTHDPHNSEHLREYNAMYRAWDEITGQHHYECGPHTANTLNITYGEVRDNFENEALADLLTSDDYSQYGNLIPLDDHPGWFYNPNTGGWVVNP